MKPFTVLVLVIQLLSVFGNEINCDPVENRGGGVLRRKCSWDVSLILSFHFRFHIETRECETSFRISSDKFSKLITEEDNTLKLPGVPLGCDEVKFNNIRSGEDGLSFCPKLACNIPSPKCVSIREDDPCLKLTDCNDCSQNPLCGWCYSDHTCRKSNDLGNSDQCNRCEDYSKRCPTCPNNCDGHGECDHGLCTCALGWGGAPDIADPQLARCDAYMQTETCDNAEITDNIVLQWGDESPSSNLVHSILRFTKRIEAIAVVGIKATNLFVSFDTPSNGATRLSDLTAESETIIKQTPVTCLSNEIPPDAVLISPPLFAGSSMWFAIDKNGHQPPPAVKIIIMSCRGAFAGFPCNSQLTTAYPWDLVKILQGNDVSSSIPVGMPGKGSHYVEFELPVYIGGIEVSVSSTSDVRFSLTQIGQIVDKERRVGDTISIKNPLPSPFWGVHIRNIGATPARGDVQILFIPCNDPSECGDAEDAGSETSLSGTWKRGTKEYVVSKRVKLGTQRVVVTSRTSENAMLRGKFGARLIEDEIPEHQVTAEEELVIYYPKPGLWYFSVYSVTPIVQNDDVLFVFQDSKCANCEETKCSLSSVPLLQCQGSQCSPAGTLSTGVCDVAVDPTVQPPPSPPTQKPAATTPSPTKATVVPVQPTPTPTPGPPSVAVTPPPHTPHDHKKYIIIFAAVAVLVCAGMFYAGSKYRFWKFTQDHLKGGYGFAPGAARAREGVEELEMAASPESDDDDEERDRNLAYQGSGEAAECSPPEVELGDVEATIIDEQE